MNTLELVHVVSPRALQRARMLEVAVGLLRAGYTPRAVSGTIRRRFSVSKVTAWRISDMARDLAGAV